MLKLNIRKKLLALIMVASIIPLIALNIYWITYQRHTLVQDAQLRQTSTTNDDADDVNTFIGNEVQALTLHSQNFSLEQANSAQIAMEAKAMLYQDNNITRLALVNRTGQETMALNANGTSSPLQNDKQSSAFKAVDGNSASQYISPATFNASKQPIVTVAVPVLTYTTPQQLAKSPTTQPQAFNGALVAQINLQVLGSSVLDLASNAGANGSYAFVVDNKGNVLAYRQQSLNGAGKNLANLPIVANFISQIGTQTISNSLQQTSEKGVKTLASYQRITVANWAVVVEDPLSIIYQPVNHVTYLGAALSATLIIIMSLLSLILSGFISRPILQLAKVAQRIGNGDLDARVEGKRNDEIGTLGESVNAMSQNLQLSIKQIGDQKRQLEVILDNTNDGILSIDQRGHVIIANAAAGKLLEIDIKQLVGQDIQSILRLAKDTQPTIIDYASLEPGVHLFRNMDYTSASGVLHHLDVVAFKIAGDMDKIVTQSIITIHDETKNRELDSMKLDFVSMAAHELRTPLSAIQGYLELISVNRNAETLPEKAQKYIAQAQSSSSELSAIISNLLSVTHIEHGTHKLTMEKVDLAEIAQRSVRSLHFNAEAKTINLTYEGSTDPSYVIGDPVALKEVINNLVDNAIKYTPTGGTITVGYEQSATSCSVRIRDNGIGIPKNALPYLFTKFFRVHGGLASGSAGTGLGLFISKSIIEEHKGTIEVASEKGQGTQFKVTLPVFDESRYSEVQQSQKAEVFKDGEKRGWSTKNINR